MIVIHVTRKPLVGTVAVNLLKYGTGAINVGRCRIRTGEAIACHHGTGRGVGMKGNEDETWPDSYQKGDAGDHNTQTSGRFPANLIFEHPPGCRRTGVKKVRSSNPTNKSLVPSDRGIWCEEGGWKRRVLTEHADPDGTETVDAWDCEADCPIVDLDMQSGDLRSPVSYIRSTDGGRMGVTCYGKGVLEQEGVLSANYGDMGGASRFFRQVHEEPG